MVALLDATGPFFEPADAAFTGATDGDWAAAQRLDPASFGAEGSWQLAFRCFALRRPGGDVTLVDAGIGGAGSPASAWTPVPGGLPTALAGADILVGDVDTVVLTHLHGDHVGWVVDDAQQPMFPRATYLVQEVELSALRNAGAGPVWEYAVQPLLESGQLKALSGRTTLAGGAAGSGDTVSVEPTPGHTVGHQSVLVSGGDQRVLVSGDALVHAVQLANPAVGYRFESDQRQATATRARVLAPTGRTVLASAHLGRPFIAL